MKTEQKTNLAFERIEANEKLYCIAKYCREKFYSKLKVTHCLCRFTESEQSKLERNDENTKDD